MDSQTILIVLFLTLVGLGCGVAIFLANRFLPEEDRFLKKTEEVAQYLPGMNCGACGKPGCFAYAGEVARDIGVLKSSPCMLLTNDERKLAALGGHLGVDLSGCVKMVSIIHCAGDSEPLFEYRGISSCRAAAQLSAGYKRCPYGCLGFGDCAAVCPVDAISIDETRKIAVVDPERCTGCGLCEKECPQNLIEIVPASLPQYLACNYLSKLNIPGRERCSIGCIHCRICVKVSTQGEVTWNDRLDLPHFDPEASLPATAAIAKCPKKVIFRLDAAGASSSPPDTVSCMLES